MRPAVLLAFLALACSTTPLPPPRTEDAPGEADAYYAQKRGGSEDPQRSYAIARERMRVTARYSTESDVLGERWQSHRSQSGGSAAALLDWTFLGPGNVGGRTRTLVIDPNSPATMYAGGVSGGIWKTVNGGARWEPIGDDLANLTVNALAMHPTNTNILYAGTGEGFFREEVRGTALPLRGNGIYVTNDGGATWSHLPSTSTADFHWVNDLAISRHDPSRLYAATRTGVWRSTDGGARWTRIVEPDVKGGCLDLVPRNGTSSDYLFASCGTFEQAKVYRTPNAESDAAWNVVLAEPHMGRTTLAVAPSNPSIVYALAASNEPGDFHQGLLAVYRSTRNGDAGSWETRLTNDSPDRMATMLLTNALYGTFTICRSANATDTFVTMGWYANAIAVDPIDPNRVWAGGVDLFRSDDGGKTWGVASYWWAPAVRSSYVHADQHAIVFHPRYDGAANRILYFTNDGGIARTDNALGEPARGPQAACNFTSNMRFTQLNNNYGVTQFYHGAVFPDGRTFIGGTQDNGTQKGTIAGGTDGWIRVLGGDGGYVAVDPEDPRYVYAESQNGALARSIDSGVRFGNATEGLEDEFLFITPFALDPNQTTRLWTGGRRLWRSENRAANWTAASTQSRGQMSAIAIAPGMSNRVIAGTSTGDIVRSESATTASEATEWSAVHPRDGFVSSLAFDPVDPNVVYATYAGFGGVHVWKSVDAAATWSPLDGSGEGALPDIPVHSIAIDPTRRDRLYLGTDLGVFVSIDGGGQWFVENSGFAAVVTESVLVAPGARGPAVYAFTHGRGVWRAELVMSGARRRGVRK